MLPSSSSPSLTYTKLTVQSAVHIATPTSSAFPGLVVLSTSESLYSSYSQSKHIVIFDTLIKQSKPEEVEAVLAHELGHWYYMHPTKLMCVSQLHIFSILALFPAFLHAPPVLRSFDFPPSVAAKPPTIIAFLLFQVNTFLLSFPGHTN